MGGREPWSVRWRQRDSWSVHTSNVRANDSRDKSFKGDLQGIRVADPRLEAMASKSPIGLRSMSVPSEGLAPARSYWCQSS